MWDGMMQQKKGTNAKNVTLLHFSYISCEKCNVIFFVYLLQKKCNIMSLLHFSLHELEA